MSDLVHDAAVQARARVGGNLGAAIADHLWAVERLRPALAEHDDLRTLDDGVLLADRLARAVLALAQPIEPDRAQLVRTAIEAVEREIEAGQTMRASDWVAVAVDTVLAAMASGAS